MEWTYFCKSNTWEIKDKKIKDDLLKIIREWWNSFECNVFPGPQPVSIERKHITKLKQDDFWVCAKTDGLRYIFACIEYDNSSCAHSSIYT